MIPGLHINTIAEIVYLAGRGFPQALFLYLIFGITLALDGVYALAFNIPDSSTGILPSAAQRLVDKNRIGYGIYSYLQAARIGLVVGLMGIPLLYLVLPTMEGLIDRIGMGIILLIALGIIVLRGFRVENLVVMILAGVLGMSAIDGYIFPMFIGFFTLPMLFIKEKLPEVEEDYRGNIPLDKIIIFSMLTALSYLFPGIATAAQIIIIASLAVELDELDYPSVLGAISGSNLVYNLVMPLIIGKTRTGVSIIIGEMIGFDWVGVLGLLGVGALAFYVTSEIILRKLRGIVDYLRPLLKVKGLLGIYLVGLVYLLSGGMGILVLGAATLIGITTLLLKAGRYNLMGSIIIPTLIHYL